LEIYLGIRKMETALTAVFGVFVLVPLLRKPKIQE
jgi:hypothetical protein